MSSDRKPRVLFTFVEAGLGHIIPMTGMCEAFSRKYGDKCEIIKSYVFRDSKREEVVSMGKELYESTKRVAKSAFLNRMEALAYYLTDEFTHFCLDIHFDEGEKAFMQDLKEIDPDLVVGSYYLPTHIACVSNEKYGTNYLTATYTPDPNFVYPAWDRRSDVFLVNDSAVYGYARNHGFSDKQLRKIPFIYREDITNLNLSKEECAKAVGMDTGKFRILFTCGAYGAKKTNALVSEILKSNLPIDLTVICGKNPQMEKDMQDLARDKSEQVGFNVVGFTDKIQYYMRGADLVIGKSGMNTVMESLYLGTPFLINAHANRLEEIIAEWFVSCDTALVVKDEKEIVSVIRKCIDNPDYLKKYVDNFEKYKDATGGEKCADVLFELLKTRYPDL